MRENQSDALRLRQHDRHLGFLKLCGRSGSLALANIDMTASKMLFANILSIALLDLRGSNLGEGGSTNTPSDESLELFALRNEIVVLAGKPFELFFDNLMLDGAICEIPELLLELLALASELITLVCKLNALLFELITLVCELVVALCLVGVKFGVLLVVSGTLAENRSFAHGMLRRANAADLQTVAAIVGERAENIGKLFHADEANHRVQLVIQGGKFHLTTTGEGHPLIRLGGRLFVELRTFRVGVVRDNLGNGLNAFSADALLLVVLLLTENRLFGKLIPNLLDMQFMQGGAPSPKSTRAVFHQEIVKTIEFVIDAIQLIGIDSATFGTANTIKDGLIDAVHAAIRDETDLIAEVGTLHVSRVTGRPVARPNLHEVEVLVKVVERQRDAGALGPGINPNRVFLPFILFFEHWKTSFLNNLYKGKKMPLYTKKIVYINYITGGLDSQHKIIAFSF